MAEFTEETTRLAGRLLEAAQRISQGADSEVDVDDVSVTRSQVAVLGYLCERDACAMLDLAAGLRVTGPTMTATVRILVRKGLVERRHHDLDWRTVMVFVTDRGRRVVEKARRERSLRLATAMIALTAEQRALLLLALPALAALGERTAASAPS
jgi:DNA-binding MarR family transcriptional regulator